MTLATDHGRLFLSINQPSRKQRPGAMKPQNPCPMHVHGGGNACLGWYVHTYTEGGRRIKGNRKGTEKKGSTTMQWYRSNT